MDGNVKVTFMGIIDKMMVMSKDGKDYVAIIDYKTGNPINHRCMIFIYEQLVSLADINERELLALILHEIGHNLYFSPTDPHDAGVPIVHSSG